MINTLLIIALNCLYAAVFPLGKIALLYASPLFITGLRMSFSAIVILIFLAWSNPKKFKENSVSMPIGYVFLYGLMAIYLTNALEFTGLKLYKSFPL